MHLINKEDCMKAKICTFKVVKPLLSITKSALILSMLLLACNGEVPKSFENKPKALGKFNEIVVVCDQQMWESAVGDTFKYYFESAYPIMPAPEPIFDLRHFTTEDLYAQPLRKELRTYVMLADLSDKDSPTTQMVQKDLGSTKSGEAMINPEVNSTVGRNKWANGQLLIYLFGKDHATLTSSIVNNFPAAADRVHEHDNEILRQRTYARELNLGYQAKIQDYFGVKLEIPADFRQVVLDEESPLLWLRKDAKNAIMNLVFMKVPYESKSQFEKDEIIKMINEYGATYITGKTPTDKLVVNEDDLPIYEYTSEIDETYSKELRGVWEMTEAFRGGPFTANLMNTEDGKDLILTFSYVYAPGEDKRDLVQQLDYMIKQIEL